MNMALSEAKKAADKRHTAKLDQIMIRPYKEKGAEIRHAAKTRGMSIQAYILEAVQKKLGIAPGGITADGKFSLDACRCIGACGLAPVMMINDDVYGRLTPDQVSGILDRYE